MAKIKNDRSRYLTRASMGGRQAGVASEKGEPARVRAVQDFLNAHIDDGMYVTFKLRDPQAKDR